MKKLMTGNEAVARGAYEGGVIFASAYPGTPSTEILENVATYRESIKAEWGPNEKVAIEACIGASMAGVRTLCAMKHVGVNVAADPLFTFSYEGVTGGFVLVSADEPGQHSSQTEQDNRNYAKAAKIAMFEPADSQECKDMVVAALSLSEEYDTPVLLRMTTRVCHSKSAVEQGPREEHPQIPYVKNIKKYIPVPNHAPALRQKIEERFVALRRYSENSTFNRIEDNGKRIGVVASGMCYHFAKEVFGQDASYLKLGFTNPLPDGLIKRFAAMVDTIYVVEEDDPYIEERIRVLGIPCKGKDFFPNHGEMTPDVLRKCLTGSYLPNRQPDPSKLVARPPGLCAGCPHRGVFYELSKRKNTVVAGDIGCYTLGFAEPFNAMDFSVCMGGSISCGHGAQQVFSMNRAQNPRVVAVIGDSTFFHTGVNSLINVAYNKSDTITIILDNRTTGMTGHQENPGTGYTLQGEEALTLDIEALVRACGIRHVENVDPNRLDALSQALDRAYAREEASVIITRWPCALKKFTREDKEEFGGAFTDRFGVEKSCVGCKICLKCGCPAIHFDGANKKAAIDPAQCQGCGVCAQVCPKGAIREVKKI